MAKYSFFEYATQHGYIVALMADRIARSREFVRIELDPSRGRVYKAFKTGNPDNPFFEYVIPERESTESTEMWRRKVSKGLGDAWKRNVREREEARSIQRGTVQSVSEPSKTESSSTDAPPKSASSSGASEAGVPVTPASVPLPSTPESSKTAPISSKAYVRRSPKSGSSSPSSSGA